MYDGWICTIRVPEDLRRAKNGAISGYDTRIRFSSAYLDFIVLRTHEIDKNLLGSDLCHPMQKEYQNLSTRYSVLCFQRDF